MTKGQVQKVHSIQYATNNTKAAALWFQERFGFVEVAERTMELGARMVCARVLRSGDIVLELISPLVSLSDAEIDSVLAKQQSPELKQKLAQVYGGPPLSEVIECCLVQRYLRCHNDGVFGIRFVVDSVAQCMDQAQLDCSVVMDTITNAEVTMGSVMIPRIDLLHTFVELNGFGGYLPGFTMVDCDNKAKFLVERVDHIVQNYTYNQIERQAKIYINSFGFHRFWSVDENDISTANTALRSVVVALPDELLKMPLNEPVTSHYRGQIEEFYDYFGGAGVQHIAFSTDDIIATVSQLKLRGVEFNTIGGEYYQNLRQRFIDDDVDLGIDLAKLEKLHILVDYDVGSRNPQLKACDYLLQIFTQPVVDRPTLFFEIIQRRGHNGFGKGTFKGLFETIERQQQLRGTLSRVD